MKNKKSQIEVDREVMIMINDVCITSNINEEGVKEHVTKSICELTKNFNKKYSKKI